MASKYPSWLNFQDTAVLELLHQWEKEDGEGNRKPTEILKKYVSYFEGWFIILYRHLPYLSSLYFIIVFILIIKIKIELHV